MFQFLPGFPVLIGNNAGQDVVFFAGENMCIGYNAGQYSETTKKCDWCEKEYDPIIASCGTGTTWSLYKCPHCEGLMAEGRIIPKVVLDDPKIKTKQLPPIGKIKPK